VREEFVTSPVVGYGVRKGGSYSYGKKGGYTGNELGSGYVPSGGRHSGHSAMMERLEKDLNDAMQDAEGEGVDPTLMGDLRKAMTDLKAYEAKKTGSSYSKSFSTSY